MLSIDCADAARSSAGTACARIALRCAVRAIAFAQADAGAQQSDVARTKRNASSARWRSARSRIDPQPEGKRIAFVDVAREDVFAATSGDSDRAAAFAPTWPNTFHWLTDPHVIGASCCSPKATLRRSARIEESMRNLRALGDLLARAHRRGANARPAAVGLLVYTRDLWSLRLETGVRRQRATRCHLTTQVSERNFLGLNKLLIARFDMDPKAFSLGEIYVDPRVLGGELALRESFDVIFNRDTGHTEGSQGVLVLERPFYNLEQSVVVRRSADYAVFVLSRAARRRRRTYRPVPPMAGSCSATSRRTIRRCMRSVWDDRSVAREHLRELSARRALQANIHVGCGRERSQRRRQRRDRLAARPAGDVRCDYAAAHAAPDLSVTRATICGCRPTRCIAISARSGRARACVSGRACMAA